MLQTRLFSAASGGEARELEKAHEVSPHSPGGRHVCLVDLREHVGRRHSVRQPEILHFLRRSRNIKD